jgi:phenylacetate-CoA ligase
MGRVDQVTKVRGLFVHPGQVDEVASKHPETARIQVVVTRKEDKDEMTFRVELKEDISQPEKLKKEIERSVRDVMKVRESSIVPRGTIPEGAKKIEDKRSGTESDCGCGLPVQVPPQRFLPGGRAFWLGECRLRNPKRTFDA